MIINLREIISLPFSDQNFLNISFKARQTSFLNFKSSSFNFK